MATQLKGLYCREIPDEPNLIEAAAKGVCAECKATGFYNYLRLQKPKHWNLIKEGAIGSTLYNIEPLTPALKTAGEGKEYLCPACYLVFIDPINFAKELHS